MKRILLTVNEKIKYKTIKAVHELKKTKARAQAELNLTRRQINRLLLAYSKKGKAAFVHGNRGRPPKHAMSPAIKKKIIRLYQAFEEYPPNITHFTEILAEEEGIFFSSTTIRSVIYSAGMLSPKSHRATRRKMKARLRKKANEKELSSLLPTATDKLEEPLKAHPSRPRKKYRGELIQMDASSFRWFAGEVTHLHLAIDDASGNIVGAYFDTQETLKGYYHVLHQILSQHGIPAAFLTDKRTVFEYKSKAMKTLEEDTFTQFGFACRQLGIEIRTSSVPQAKGRVERLNGTVQSRLPVDLARAQITTIEAANDFLKTWIRKYNRQFGEKAQETVFEKAPTSSEMNLLLARVTRRKVDNGHHVRFNNHHYLPVQGKEDRYFTRRTEALVIEAFDGEIYLNIADRIYHSRKLLSHELQSNEFDFQPEIKKERIKYIPPQSHPWKLNSFKKYLRSIGKTLEEYEAEKVA